MALVLGHLFATDLHGGLEHKVHVVGAPLRDVGGGPTRFPILVCLVPSVLGSLEVTLQDGLGYEHLFTSGAGQVLLGRRPPTAAASANLPSWSWGRGPISSRRTVAEKEIVTSGNRQLQLWHLRPPATRCGRPFSRPLLSLFPKGGIDTTTTIK